MQKFGKYGQNIAAAYQFAIRSLVKRTAVGLLNRFVERGALLANISWFNSVSLPPAMFEGTLYLKKCLCYNDFNMTRENKTNPKISSENETQTKDGLKSKMIWVILAGLVILGALIIGVVLLARSDAITTSHIRDIFIIVLALESLIIGAALVILVIQLALLINLLQNEIKPILETTRKTVNTLKGTSTFLSEHAVRPVMQLSSLAAGFRKLVEIIGIIKK
jgi:hypothetical protein